MKKLFFLLLISSALLSSCNKEANDVEPVQVTCDCDDSSISSSFNCDTSLVGLWIGTGNNGAPLGGGSYDLFISESGYGYFNGSSSNSGYYDCSGGFLSFNGGYAMSGNYSISGNTMTYEIIAGDYGGFIFTLTKQ
jgi:hypothetical protein